MTEGVAIARIKFVKAVAASILTWGVSGCAGTPPADIFAPPAVPFGSVGFDIPHDDRAHFAGVFCQVLRDRVLPHDLRPRCSDYLWQSAPDDPLADAVGSLRHRWRLNIVPGYLGACLTNHVQAFGDAVSRLETLGVEVNFLHASGRGSSTSNGQEIADQLRELPQDNRMNVVVAYSKGAPDLLEAEYMDPAVVSRVFAVVTVAGALGGSPLADYTSPTLLGLLSFLPIYQCRKPDNGGIESLRTEVRTEWTAGHPLLPGPKYFSLITLPRRSNVSRALRGNYEKLAKISAGNDGQLLNYDEIVPGMTLLGYADADHWAMALPLKDSGILPHWLSTFALDRNDFPREAMMEAIIRYLDAIDP